MEEPVNVFFSYSHQDEKLRNKLEVHLSTLQRQKVIKSWHDRKIGAGIEWAQAIDDNLNAADIILLLISADFLASDYCYGLEIERAIARHDAGEARVIPIILRPTDLHGTPFGKLQAFPRDAKPVTRWSNRDEAFVNIAQGIRQAAHEMSQVLRDRRTAQPVPTIVEHAIKRSEDGDLSPKTESIAGASVGDRGAIAPNSSAHVDSFLEEEERRSFAVELGNGVLLEMVAIPGGTFWMGSPDGEGSDAERPCHHVTIAPFWIGEFVVTQSQYESVIGGNPSRFIGANRPVEEVSWNDAVEFCQELSAKAKRQFRLPSEAEWEYACRAGTTTPFYFGETISTDQANYNGQYIYGSGKKGEYRQKTTNIRSFPPNAFGLCDMHGNVWQWCLDHWHKSYEGAPTDGSAWIDQGSKEAAKRLVRGGSWYDSPKSCRSAHRNYGDSHDTFNYLGFRIVCSSPRTLA